MAALFFGIISVMAIRFTYLAASCSLIIATIWAYAPGLSGDLLFDDLANLNALGATGPVDDWPTFWRYITSGAADPTGRPLALLSFLIDGHNWPADPYPFKRTNLLLHLLNGALLGTALLRLGRIIAPEQAHRAALAAILGCAIWTLHPLMVSTTLYVVQRQAMLPATALLLALHSWISGRQQLANGLHFRATLCLLISIFGGTALAVLSKGNGLLLPMLIGTIEISILRRWAIPVKARRLAQIRIHFLLLPALVVVAYLLWRIPGAIESTPSFRPWTLGERLLTQPRIVLDYISLLLAPRPFTSGLYNDNITISTSLLSPWTTLPAIVLILCIPITGWILRKRYPLVSGAALFFSAGHLMESSVIPLEMYYEHRNYLPSLLAFWPIAWWLAKPDDRKPLRITASLLILAALTGMTHARAKLWGNDTEQALVWAALNPESPRAQATAALHEMQSGRQDLAYARLNSLGAAMANEPQIALNRLNAACLLNSEVSNDDLNAASHALKHAQHGLSMAYGWIENMLERAYANTCQGFYLEQAGALLNAIQLNDNHPPSPQNQQKALHLKARIALLEKRPDDALRSFNKALALNPQPGIALKQAATLGQAGHPDLGLTHLNYFNAHTQHLSQPPFGMQRIHALVLESQGYWRAELDHLRHSLERDLNNTAPNR